MTFFHFGNCVALAYVPYLITYKFSGLSEYSTFYKCVYAGKIMEFFKGTIGKEFRLAVFFHFESLVFTAGCSYLFTQLIKMMILATFFPTSESPVGLLDIKGEFLKV